jgi:hypothetical protein
VLAQTIRHFWPELNDWLDDVPDPRSAASTTYAARFLLWWGLSRLRHAVSGRGIGTSGR